LGREESGLKLVVGARLVFADDTPDIVAYPATRHGWGRLTRLLTLGNRRAEKGDCILRLPDLLDHADDLLLIATGQDRAVVEQLREARPDAVWIAAHMLRSGADARRLAQVQALSAATGAPILASNDALYDTPDARPLHDILTCIREGATIHTAGRLAINAERYLKSPAEMARLFRACPEAIAASIDVLNRITLRWTNCTMNIPMNPCPMGGTRKGGWNISCWRAAAPISPMV
jgi:error-prone DNA polymerase